MAQNDRNQRRSEASRVKSANEQDLLNLPNVTGVFTGTKVTGGVDTGRIAIVVTVTEKQDVPEKSRIPAEINGVPTDVIEEVIEPMLVANLVRVDEIVPFVDTTNYATLEGGMSIGPCRSIHLEPPDVDTAGDYVFVGTLGCIVRDNTTNDPMMLSNFHVMCVDDSWSAGDTMAQPSRVDGGSCPADQVGALQRAVLDASVDGAVASVSGRPTACEIIDIGDVNGTAVATVDANVRKRGRTTELTHGRIAATDYTTSVDYGDGLGVVTFTNQIRIVNDAPQSAFFGKKGDSGSVVVDEDNNVVGLYFAGNSTGTVGVANQIADVLSALDVSICTGGIKKFEKEYFKDFDSEKWNKIEKFEIKEFEKERFKEFVKEWKEYAYEKFDWEGTFDPWDRINPWERPGVTSPPVGAVRPPQRPGLRSMFAQSDPMGEWKEVPTRGGCAEFGRLPEGNGPNPIAAPPFYLTVFDYLGVPLPASTVVNWSGYSGLNAGWMLEIRIRGKCPSIQATMVHYATPATMEAYNADGSLAGTATMGSTQGVPQVMTITGTEIVRARIVCPSNETILLRLCCCCDTTCVPCEKPKESKEYKEIKEVIKDYKEFGKDLKEPKEFKEIREDLFDRPPFARSSVEERLAAIEQAMGVGGTPHFIPQSLRPDLSQGALRREPQPGNRARLRRQTGR